MIRAALAWLAVCLGCLGGTVAVDAHELRPGYLELREQAGHVFDVIWKVPARGENRLALYARLPQHCAHDRTTLARDGNAVVERWRAECPGGLSGHEITVEGLQTTLTDVLVRLQRLDGTVQVTRLTPDQPGFTVTETQDRLTVTVAYFLLGVEHILIGFDHLLFVLALLLIVPDWRRLLLTVTSFTVAHSMTLAAATLGVLTVPGPPVEAVIALSIMFLASEMLRLSRGKASMTARNPWLVAFIFGLLHGLGFAGALKEIGLPAGDIPLALLTFNLGVEAGQVMFVGAVLTLWWALKRVRIDWPAWAKQSPAYVIGTVSAFWLVERIAGFW